MWKDFFYFSRGQRIGILVLIFLIAMVLLTNFLLPLLLKTDKKETDSRFVKEAAEFKSHLQSVDSLRQLEWERKYAENNRFPEKYKAADNYSLFPFDPNTCDSATFVKLGLKNFVAHNILKYRNKGGIFKTPESFSKVYGVSAEKYNELKPYIRISVPEKATLAAVKDSAVNRNQIKQESIIVELNSADTTELMKVKGIGRGYAKGIVRFRNETGGFVSINQLKEVYGMTDQNFEKMKSFCTINLQLVRKINVNTASVEKLNAHPYLDFYQSKAIYELRRKKLKLKSIDDLKSIRELTTETISKIEPYLIFN